MDEVQACRTVPVSEAAAALVAATLARGGTTLGRLAGLLHEDPATGRARTYALAARRVVHIDLDRGLHDGTECRATPTAVHPLPSIRG